MRQAQTTGFLPLSPPYYQSYLEINRKLAQIPDSTVHLIFEDTQHFECSQCASCCDDEWHLEVTQEYYEKWADYWANPPTTEIVDPFERLPNPTPQAYARLKKKPHNTECIFLMANRGCFIHKYFGLEGKPEGCQAYPHALKLTPNHYTVMYLLKSCQSSPALMAPYPGVYYQIKPIDASQAQFFMPVSRQKHLPLPSHNLWLGLALDLLVTPDYSPLESLNMLSIALDNLLNCDLETVSVEKMDFIHQETQRKLRERGFSQMPPLAHRKIALGWFLTLAKYRFQPVETWLKNQLQSRSILPGLSEVELKTYHAFLRLYLHQKLITQNYHDTMIGELNLFQHCLVLALQQLSLQFILLYFKDTQKKPVDAHLLSRAVNWVERKLGHAPTWMAGMGIYDLSPQACLGAFETCLSLRIQNLDFSTEI